VANARSLASARDRVERICDAATDARTLRLDVLTEIRRAIDVDAYAWLLTDPETSVGTAPLADVPCLPELPSLIRLKYLTALNRWSSMSRPVALLTEAAAGDLSRSLLWRELLYRFDVGDVASSVFRDRYGCWGFLDLWRIGGEFDRAEAAFLGDLAAPLTTAIRRVQALTLIPVRRIRPRGPAVLLLSPGLEVRAQTSQTADYLSALVPAAGDAAPVPAAAYNVAAQLLANEAGIDMNPPSARVHLSGGSWLTLRAARIGGPDADLAVSIEEIAPDERATLFARAHGLSPREQVLLLALATGGDTRELAGELVLSEHTVQDHLQSIFGKTGLRSRQALLAHAFGA